jgi:hypothetical protein
MAQRRTVLTSRTANEDKKQLQRLTLTSNKNSSHVLLFLVTVLIFLVVCVPFVCLHFLSDDRRQNNYSPILTGKELLISVKDRTGITPIYSASKRVRTEYELSPPMQPKADKEISTKVAREVPLMSTETVSRVQQTNNHLTPGMADEVKTEIKQSSLKKDVGHLKTPPSEISEFAGAILDTSAPFIHIVNTRLQQHASNLPALGAARLELFETFCLPSMIHQTIQPQSVNQTYQSQQKFRFLWIIKTDPKLDSTLKH